MRLNNNNNKQQQQYPSTNNKKGEEKERHDDQSIDEAIATTRGIMTDPSVVIMIKSLLEYKRNKEEKGCDFEGDVVKMYDGQYRVDMARIYHYPSYFRLFCNR